MNKFISWIATGSSIIGAFLVAMQIITIGYCFFVFGAIGWLFIGYTNKDNALITLNGVFLIANILGLYNAI